jgi:rhodanese-related sulfurtransferase
MATLQNAVTTANNKMPDVTPTPPGFHSQASAHELKSRLDWGEPGLTIVDSRDRDRFNQCRILGANNLTASTLPNAALGRLSFDRDIYIYSNTDSETASVAQRLREAGFTHVAELKGGLDAWKAIGGAIDGIETNRPPGPDAYNLKSRLQTFANEKQIERTMR